MAPEKKRISYITWRSVTDISNGVRYMYGTPLELFIGPSLTEKTFANGKPLMGDLVEIVATEVQSVAIQKGNYLKWKSSSGSCKSYIFMEE